MLSFALTSVGPLLLNKFDLPLTCSLPSSASPIYSIMDSEIRLQHPFPGDDIEAGRYWFARIDNKQPPTADSWALVMIVTEDLIPETTLEAKQRALSKVTSSEAYPCWLMGQGKL